MHATATDTIASSPLLRSREIGSRKLEVGAPAAIVKNYGKGKIACIYGPVFESYLNSYDYPGIRAFLSDLIKSMDVSKLMKVEAQPCVQVSLRMKNGNTHIHLVNVNGLRTNPHRTDFIETVPNAGPVKIRLSLKSAPESVVAQPSGESVEFIYEEGLLAIDRDRVEIHEILVISPF